MTEDDRIPIAVEFDEDEYAQLVAAAERRGLSVQALLDEIIAAQLRRLRRRNGAQR